MVILGEIFNGTKSWKRALEMIQISPHIAGKSFDELDTNVVIINPRLRVQRTVNVKSKTAAWIQFAYENMKRKLRIVNYENSIQFSLQTAKLLYDVRHPNVMGISPTSGLMVYRSLKMAAVMSIALSTKSIFGPIIDRERVISATDGRPNSALTYAIKSIQIIMHLGSTVLNTYLTEF